MEKKNNTGLIIFIVLFALAVAVGITQTIITVVQNNKASEDVITTEKAVSPFVSSNKKKDNDADKTKTPKKPYYAKLQIEGTIQEENQTYNQKWLLSTIDRLEKDSNNKGIILFMDSPGGTVYESDEAYLRLMKYKENTGRPVYAYFGKLSCSGSYYISCSADYIMANRNCLTGSIGVISGQFIDLTGLMEKYGVKATTIHSGRNKTMGNYSTPMTEEQRQIMQSISDECYQQFTSIVADSRKMTLTKVYQLADGRVYTAKQAKSNGLIDEVGEYDDLITYIQNEKNEGEKINVVNFAYEREESFYDKLMNSKTSASSPEAAVAEELKNLVETDVPFPAYYFDTKAFF